MVYYDYLIVGQGIAGTMLAHFLLKKGRKILVVDQYKPSSASQVSAGIINPLTGRRLVKTWMADLIHPFAENTYRELERILETKFWYKMNIARILSATEEHDYFIRRNESEEYSGFINTSENIGFTGLKESVLFEISGGGYLDMAKLIKECRKKLQQSGILLDEPFLNADLVLSKEVVYWKGNSFRKIVFCEGYTGIDNPLFDWVPFVPAKGEVLIIHSQDLNIDKIVMKDVFILPLGNCTFKVGATYTWNELNSQPTENGKTELTNKLKGVLGCSYTIVKHLAGIRPVVKDRKPCLGMHPMYSSVGFFNGLGTKGASLAPYFANHFVDFLEENKFLDKEVDISRFYKYFKS